MTHRASLIATATGHVGDIVALQLNKYGVKTAALVRASQTDSSGQEDALRKLKSADIRIMVGSPDGDQAKLAELLRKIDRDVTAIAGERDNCVPGIGCKSFNNTACLR